MPRVNLQVASKVQNSILGGENPCLKKKRCFTQPLYFSAETEGFTLILILNKQIVSRE